ncbi:unnamed protein product [Arctogadus glacialis]
MDGCHIRESLSDFPQDGLQSLQVLPYGRNRIVLQTFVGGNAIETSMAILLHLFLSLSNEGTAPRRSEVVRSNFL